MRAPPPPYAPPMAPFYQAPPPAYSPPQTAMYAFVPYQTFPSAPPGILHNVNYNVQDFVYMLVLLKFEVEFRLIVISL